MIVSAIETNQYIYVNLHAEEVITSNFLEDDNIGIFGDRLQVITMDRVIKELKESWPSNKTIVFDFKGISACQPNLNKLIFDLKHEDYKILFLNLKNTVADDLSLTAIVNSKNICSGDFYTKYFFFENENDPLTSAVVDVSSLFYETFKEKIKKYIEPHQKPHTSSYVYLTSYVDIKKFISFEKNFMLFSLYRLALKIYKKWPDEIRGREIILICQSMNSAYIVSVLSNLLKLDILILDKIGPINKIYNHLDKTISKTKKYIVVSDLVCLGTEVKIVKSLIQFLGGKFLGNVSIIKTETLSKADILNADATIAVFSIKRSNNKELNFSITTDLESLS